MQTGFMKTRVILLAIILLFSLSWKSCKEEKADGPSATITELGYNNTGVGYIGGTFHVMADIVADGKIENIQIGVHQATLQKIAGIEAEGANSAWVFDTVYTEKYAGATSAAFDEWFDIPPTADTGAYNLQLKVMDMEGIQFLVEEKIRLDYGKKY